MYVNHMVKYSSARLDLVFGALADPTRRAMISRLARGESTVTALATPFRISLPAVSKHLKVLERAGLVRRTVAGRVHHCALVAAPLDQATEWVRYHRRFWADRLDALDTLLTPTPGKEVTRRANR